MSYISVPYKPKYPNIKVYSAIDLDQASLTSHQQFIRIKDQQKVQKVQKIVLSEEEKKKQILKKSGLNQKYRKYVTNLKMVKSSKKCTICLEGFVKDQVIKKFPCNHIFHRECGKGWMKVNKKCPVCRFNLEQYFTDLQKQGKLQNPNKIKNFQKCKIIDSTIQTGN